MQQLIQQQLVQAQDYMQRGQSGFALMAVRKVLRKDKGNIDALLIMAEIAKRQGDMVQLTEATNNILALDQQNVEALSYQLELAINKEHHFDVVALCNKLEQLEIASFTQRYQKALALLSSGQILAAKACFQSLLSEQGEDVNVLLNLGHVHKALAESATAADYYHQFISKATHATGVGYWSLADLKDYRFNRNEQQQLLTELKLAENDKNKALLCFAIARSFEQQNDYQQAFRYMQQGNDLMHALRPFKAQAYHQLISDLMRVKDVKASAIAHQNKQPRPIFIVGMPRSGTTLVEQILAAHSQVETTDELPFIERIAIDIQGPSYAQAIERLTPTEINNYRQRYLQQVSDYFDGDVELFIDKNPNNYLHIGLIKTLFPEAKIINLVRNPIDNAMSVYKQYFANGHDYSYHLGAISFYWQGYLTLMFHWQNLLGKQLYHVSYEQLTADSEQQIKQLVDYCELPFEQQCLTFYKSDKAVLTPSVSQVKQPINRRSVGSGQHYWSFFKDKTTWQQIEQKAAQLAK
ncbi:sulfotransferase [Thalassotalea ponticola]|uniref:tetratricopeptide repeat-containing sulfotransferase family protein n=1 Tax=Thalassotalea ponticola TaxID=1523392 RepID=UPI0025B4F35A|nr:tetratricopeptide repeat-containing sulfotransferase family protein [Thalassotalea ponticola]MDN3653150.1 sulfotransferase [Thalassotalea ponticola]